MPAVERQFDMITSRLKRKNGCNWRERALQQNEFLVTNFSEEEFFFADSFWGAQDWKQFLKTDDYYKVN